MCGIAGIFTSQFDSNTKQNLINISRCLIKRGSDSDGQYFDDENIGFIHTRLKIIDLSDNGNQPMISSSGRYVITYNISTATRNHRLIAIIT